jgi:hypothetical protein
MPTTLNPFDGKLQLTGAGGASIGGTVTSGTTGSILFVGAASVLAQDNTSLFFDDTANRFCVGNTSSTGTGRRAAATGDFIILGNTAAVNANIRIAITYTSHGWSSPAAVGSSGIGEKLVFQDLTSSAKAAIGIDGDSAIWFQSANAASVKRFKFYGIQAGTGAGSLLAMITADGAGNASFIVGNDNAPATSQLGYVTGDFIRIGLGGVAASATNKTAIIFNNQGAAVPSAANASSNGDKLVFLNNSSSIKAAIGLESLSTAIMTFQSSGSSTSGFKWYSSDSGAATQRMYLDAYGSLGINGSSFGTGSGVVFLGNASVVPSTNPTAGGVLYTEAGALKYRGSSGTVTTIAPA